MFRQKTKLDNISENTSELELGTDRGQAAAVRLGNHENAVKVWHFPNGDRLGHVQKPHLDTAVRQWFSKQAK